MKRYKATESRKTANAFTDGCYRLNLINGIWH